MGKCEVRHESRASRHYLPALLLASSIICACQSSRLPGDYEFPTAGNVELVGTTIGGPSPTLGRRCFGT